MSAMIDDAGVLASTQVEGGEGCAEDMHKPPTEKELTGIIGMTT